jgi:Kef-type K+ transport system membrane component KefB
MTLGIFVFQVTSAGLAARYTSGMNRAESIMIGFGMLGRAELAFVVMDIAYVQHSILNAEAFFTLMMTAFCLNILVPVSIGLWRPVYLRETAN